MTTSIEALADEFRRLDNDGAGGYVCNQSIGQWPSIGFSAGDGGWPVVSAESG